jgi:hypothetical protein
VAILLDQGVYLGSISTFYRLLRRAGDPFLTVAVTPCGCEHSLHGRG